MRRGVPVLLALGFALAACGGGGGGGPSTPPPPQQSLVFTPAGTPEVNTIHLDAAAASTPDRLVLEVRANEVDDLFGLGFDLLYPTSFLAFDAQATDEGDFLDEPGVRTELIVDEGPGGRLLIGYSRLGDDEPGASGSGLLLTLEFATTASGQGDFTIENELAIDGAGARRFDYLWLAGNLRVTK